jgi:hypothetical protein
MLARENFLRILRDSEKAVLSFFIFSRRKRRVFLSFKQALFVILSPQMAPVLFDSSTFRHKLLL